MLQWALRFCGLVSFLALLGLAWMAATRFLPDTLPRPSPFQKGTLIILVSSGVGFTTNWLAIKMLFRPRRRLSWLLLWPQGLLPREQGRLARALGAVSETRLLNPEAIAASLAEDRLRIPLGRALRRELDAILAAPETRDLLTQYVTDTLRNHGPGLVRRMRPDLREAIESAVNEHITSERVLNWLENAVHSFASNREMRRSLAKWIAHETTREGVVVKIMDILREQFFRYRDRHPVRGFLAEQFVIDWDSLRESIIATLRSEEATEDLAEVLVDMAGGIMDTLRTERTYEAIVGLRGRLVERALDWFEEEGIATLADRIGEMTGESTAWEVIESALDDLAERIPEALFEPRSGRLRRPVQERLAGLQNALIDIFPVAEIVEKQVLAMNPAAVENMVDEIGRRELAWIQILGLILGAAAGSALLLVV